VNGNSTCAQIVDPHNRRYDVATQVVKDQNLPYRHAFFIKYWHVFGREAIGVGVVLSLRWFMVEIEELFD
jgi:hypothetical protein